MSASGRAGWVSRLLLACSLAMLTVPVAHAATGEGESAATPPKPRAASAAKKESTASAAATAASKAKNKAKAGSTPAEPAKKPVAKPASPPPASAANDGDNMMVKRRKAEPPSRSARGTRLHRAQNTATCLGGRKLPARPGHQPHTQRCLAGSDSRLHQHE